MKACLDILPVQGRILGEYGVDREVLGDDLEDRRYGNSSARYTGSTTHDGGIGGDSHGHDVRVVAQRASVQSISLVVSGLGYPFSGLRHIVAIVIGTIVAAKTHYTEV